MDAKVLVDAKVLTILSMAGQYNKPVRERVCPYKLGTGRTCLI